MADEYILQIAILTVNINDTYTTTLPHPIKMLSLYLFIQCMSIVKAGSKVIWNRLLFFGILFGIF